MTRAALGMICALALAACGAAPAPPPALPQPGAPRLLPPAPLDPDARGAAYLSAVALQLQPGWGQFLDDCRLRLPATHTLNTLSLAATAELAIDARGQVVTVSLVSSGNAGFDRAVHDAITDAQPLPAPPRALWSDDDRVHLRWLSAGGRPGNLLTRGEDEMLKRTLTLAAAVAVLAAPAAVRAGQGKDVGGTAVAAGSFKTLATALQAAGLVETLKGKGPFTVFAPTDEAFAKIPKADLDALIADKSKLTKVLTYHVVAGKVLAADVTKLKDAKTVEGQMVKIDTSNGVKVGGASVIKADVEASNGVIHVIDSVIFPQ